MQREKSFIPISYFSCMDTGDYFDKTKAVKWAWEVSIILGTIPVSLYRTMPNPLPDEFVEDFE